jgi:hypothetical protein
MVMDTSFADKIEALKGRKGGPSRAMLKLILFTSASLT